MFNRNPAVNPKLDDNIDQCLTDLKACDPANETYATIVGQLTNLYAIKSNQDNRVDKNQLIAVMANLGGIVAILNYEKAAVVTSKAIAFLARARV